MTSQPAFELNLNDARSVEDVYRLAVRENRVQEFEQEIRRCHESAPDNMLLAAWYYRLQPEPALESKQRPPVWRLVVPFSLVLSLIYWLVAPRFDNTGSPWNFLTLWAPVTACLLIVFLFAAELSVRGMPVRMLVSTRDLWVRPGLIILVIAAVTVFAYAMGRSHNDVYSTLLMLHLPLLCILAVGLFMAWPLSDQSSFAAIHKWAEILLTAGIMAGAVLAFDGITLGLFSAIRTTPSEPTARWFIFGMLGLIPVITFAITYTPALPMLEQRFDQGVAKLIFNIARLLLPLTIIVGAAYIASIPANFLQPFKDRDVLIIYNVMLFAVMALSTLR